MCTLIVFFKSLFFTFGSLHCVFAQRYLPWFSQQGKCNHCYLFPLNQILCLVYNFCFFCLQSCFRQYSQQICYIDVASRNLGSQKLSRKYFCRVFNNEELYFYRLMGSSKLMCKDIKQKLKTLRKSLHPKDRWEKKQV